MKKAPWLEGHGAFEFRLRLRAGGDDADGFANFMPGLVDVAKSTLLESLCKAIVFFVSNIFMGFAE